MGEIQKHMGAETALDKLPFDLRAELGEILKAEIESPGVYYLLARKEEDCRELYVVTAEAPAISAKARSYGQRVPSHPALRVYDLQQPGSGRRIIDYEICRYQMKCRLPLGDADDALYVHALYGAEEHPDYFGQYPVPLHTPRGRTTRHKAIIHGVYWLETERCEEMLAVCYPIWQADLPKTEQMLGEQLEYDRMRGIDSTYGYLFFPKQSSAIPLYALSQVHPELKASGAVDMPALLNAICAYYPEYTAMHNQEALKYAGRSDLINQTPGVGTDFIGF